MVSSSVKRQSANHKQVRNKKLPSTDYEASSRNVETTKYSNRENIEVMTVGEVAELLQVSTWSVYELVKSGELPHFKVGRSVRFVRGEIVGWMLR
jgi:excisionase family DNA binding protein